MLFFKVGDPTAGSPGYLVATSPQSPESAKGKRLQGYFTTSFCSPLPWFDRCDLGGQAPELQSPTGHVQALIH